MTKEKLMEILGEYDLSGRVVSVDGFGDGHINDTFLLRTELDGEETKYILQRINTDIFVDYKGLMSNVEKVTKAIKDSSENPEDEVEVIKTKNGELFVECDEGVYRMYNYINNSIAYSYAEDLDLLYEAGYAFGDFQKKLKSFDPSSLADTIPRFHDTLFRFEQLDEAIAKNKAGRLEECKEEIDFAMARREESGAILEALESGDVKLRVTHNDTKINNVLMNEDTNKAMCVIDLDTVMAGSVLYDFGDAIRSCGSTLIEDAKNIEDLKVNFDNFEAYSKGFLAALGDDLTDKEREMLPLSAIIMTLECGIRFLADYLNGDTYYKTAYAEHNLVRARNQFKYVLELEKNYEKLVTIIAKF